MDVEHTGDVEAGEEAGPETAQKTARESQDSGDAGGAGDPGPLPTPGALPAAVRHRVAVLTAAVLPDLGVLPPTLRSVAGFAPARRARLGERAILAALADHDFRAQVATQVLAGASADPGSDADVVARAWLAGDDGVSGLLAAAPPPAAPTPDPAAERLRERLAAAEREARAARDRHKETVDRLKSDNATLRRTLGDTRSAERALREDVDRLAEEVGRLRSAAAAAEADVRRLRGQLDQARTLLQAARQDDRTERDEATLRARLLLDAVIDAAAGLRRELALPPVTGSPGERVEGALARQPAPGEGGRATSASGALGPTSPTLLDQLLTLPRSRLIVDGYNVTMAAWPQASLEQQRQRLLAGLAPLVARTGAETTVVFDAHGSVERPVVSVPRGLKVLFTQVGVIADDVIRELVAAEPSGRTVVVVSNDQEVVRDVVRDGARAIASPALVGLLNRGV